MADNYNIKEWKTYFVKMAKGEIPYSKFYVVNNQTTTTKKETPITLVSPTEQAVEQAKSELKSNRGIKRSYEEDDIIINDNKKRPPGNRVIIKKGTTKPTKKGNKKSVVGQPLWR